MFLKYSIFFSLAFFSLRPINTPNTPLAIKNSAIHISSGIFMLYSIMEWCGNQPRKFLFGRETEYIQSRFQGIRGDSGGIQEGKRRPCSNPTNIRSGILPEDHGVRVRGAFSPPSHKSASRAVFMKKGTPAQSRNPFENCHGAEGGTRTPTGFPTTPSSRSGSYNSHKSFVLSNSCGRAKNTLSVDLGSFPY